MSSYYKNNIEKEMYDVSLKLAVQPSLKSVHSFEVPAHSTILSAVYSHSWVTHHSTFKRRFHLQELPK